MKNLIITSFLILMLTACTKGPDFAGGTYIGSIVENGITTPVSIVFDTGNGQEFTITQGSALPIRGSYSAKESPAKKNLIWGTYIFESEFARNISTNKLEDKKLTGQNYRTVGGVTVIDSLMLQRQ